MITSKVLYLDLNYTYFQISNFKIWITYKTYDCAKIDETGFLSNKIGKTFSFLVHLLVFHSNVDYSLQCCDFEWLSNCWVISLVEFKRATVHANQFKQQKSKQTFFYERFFSNIFWQKRQHLGRFQNRGPKTRTSSQSTISLR